MRLITLGELALTTAPLPGADLISRPDVTLALENARNRQEENIAKQIEIAEAILLVGRLEGVTRSIHEWESGIGRARP